MGNFEMENWSIWYLGSLLAIGIFGHFFIYRLLKWIAKKTPTNLDDHIVKHCYRSLQWIVILLAARVVIPYAVTKDHLPPIEQAISILFIILVSYLVIKVMYVFEAVILNRYDLQARDNLQARKVHTQLNVIKRIVIIIVGLLALGMILMVFDRVRQLGTTILASAGVIGIVVGFAAQRTLGTFFAGLQIAFTQPIRIDDVVIVEGEWGRIEEITLTYVVVKIWDLRRLVVPITYFIETPFQNWTKTSADILGTVFIYVDYTVPISEIREKLNELLNQSEHWDKKVCVLQVTNTTDRSVEIRALMSAADASTAWTLRCEIREKLIEYIRDNYPQSLPRARVELEKQD